VVLKRLQTERPWDLNSHAPMRESAIRRRIVGHVPIAGPTTSKIR
jgi:hypothetical protein